MPTKPFLVWWFIDYEGWYFEEFDLVEEARAFAETPHFGRKYVITQTIPTSNENAENRKAPPNH